MVLVVFLLVLHRAGQGHFADERSGKDLDVLAAAYLGVGHGDEVDYRKRDEQSEHERDEQNLLGVGSGRERRALGLGDDTGVVGGECLGKLVLLTLLEEEHVEGFLDFLLTLDAEQVLGLVGVVGQAGSSLLFRLLDTALLGLEGIDQVVDGSQDGAAHSHKAGIHFLHERVALGGIGHDVVALQHQVVVLAYLSGDVGVAQAGGRREHIRHSAGGAHRSADVTGCVELVVQVLNLAGGLLGLVHIHTRHCRDVRNHILALVGRDIGIDAAELLLDVLETLVDEERSAHGHLVAVVNPVLVVHLDDHIQHVLGPAGALVGEGQVKHVGVVLLVQGGRAQTVVVRGRGLLHRVVVHIDSLVEGCGASLVAHNHERAAYGGKRVPEGAGILLHILGVGDFHTNLEARGGDGGHFEVHPACRLDKLRLDRERDSVDDVLAGTAGDKVIEIQAHTLHDAAHQVGRLEGDDFIGQLGVLLGHTARGEHRLQVAGGTPHGGFLDEHGGGTRVNLRGLDDVVSCNAKAHDDRNHEPVPPGEAFAYEFPDIEAFSLGAGILVGIDVFCHNLLVCGSPHQHDSHGGDDGGGKRSDGNPEGSTDYVVAVDG